MRSAPIVAILLTGTALMGCNAECGAPQQYNGFAYRGFANPVSFESDNARFTASPEYWSYGTPANGVAEWNFQWGGVPDGPVTVVINGQPFEGLGTQDQLECGLGTVDFAGDYADPASLVVHKFNASMAFNIWTDDGVGHLGAFMIWKEAWEHPSGERGIFNADVHLAGDLITQFADES